MRAGGTPGRCAAGRMRLLVRISRAGLARAQPRSSASREVSPWCPANPFDRRLDYAVRAYALARACGAKRASCALVGLELRARRVVGRTTTIVTKSWFWPRRGSAPARQCLGLDAFANRARATLLRTCRGSHHHIDVGDLVVASLLVPFSCGAPGCRMDRGCSVSPPVHDLGETVWRSPRRPCAGVTQRPWPSAVRQYRSLSASAVPISTIPALSETRQRPPDRRGSVWARAHGGGGGMRGLITRPAVRWNLLLSRRYAVFQIGSKPLVNIKSVEAERSCSGCRAARKSLTAGLELPTAAEVCAKKARERRLKCHRSQRQRISLGRLLRKLGEISLQRKTASSMIVVDNALLAIVRRSRARGLYRCHHVRQDP